MYAFWLLAACTAFASFRLVARIFELLFCCWAWSIIIYMSSIWICDFDVLSLTWPLLRCPCELLRAARISEESWRPTSEGRTSLYFAGSCCIDSLRPTLRLFCCNDAFFLRYSCFGVTIDVLF